MSVTDNIAVKNENRTKPNKINMADNNRPKNEVGTTSPKPTCVIVAQADHIPSKSECTSGSIT